MKLVIFYASCYSPILLLQVLAGHDGPVSGLCFSPSRSLLASSSWDKTVRVWDVLGGKAKYETFRHVADGKKEKRVRSSGVSIAVGSSGGGDVGSGFGCGGDGDDGGGSGGDDGCEDGGAWLWWW